MESGHRTCLLRPPANLSSSSSGATRASDPLSLTADIIFRRRSSGQASQEDVVLRGIQ